MIGWLTDNKYERRIKIQALNSDNQLALEAELARQSPRIRNRKNNQNEINVGVDTSKTQLDIYRRPLDIYFIVTNDEKGINKAIREIKKQAITDKLDAILIA